MSKHATPRKQSTLNRTIGAGIVAGGLALGGVGLLAPATASADFQFGGQNNSPGAAGGDLSAGGASNNTFVFGRNNRTTVTQTNGNNTGGNGNTVFNFPIFP